MGLDPSVALAFERVNSKLERVLDSQSRIETDFGELRKKHHDLANVVQGMVAKQQFNEGQSSGQTIALAHVASQRLAYLRVTQAIIGILGVGGIAALAKIFIGH